MMNPFNLLGKVKHNKKRSLQADSSNYYYKN